MDQKTIEKTLQKKLAELLAGDRKLLEQDKQIINAFHTKVCTEHTITFSARANNRFSSLVGCLAEVVQFVDEYLQSYREDLQARKALRFFNSSCSACSLGYELAKKINKRQAEEITKLLASAKDRKRKIERDIDVMRALGNRVNVLRKKEKIRKHLNRL